MRLNFLEIVSVRSIGYCSIILSTLNGLPELNEPIVQVELGYYAMTVMIGPRFRRIPSSGFSEL